MTVLVLMPGSYDIFAEKETVRKDKRNRKGKPSRKHLPPPTRIEIDLAAVRIVGCLRQRPGARLTATSVADMAGQLCKMIRNKQGFGPDGRRHYDIVRAAVQQLVVTERLLHVPDERIFELTKKAHIGYKKSQPQRRGSWRAA